MSQTPSEHGEKTAFDVYARSFVPRSLKAVNDVPANVIKCTPVRWIDFEAYFCTFAGTHFIHTEWKAWQMLLQDSGIERDTTPRIVSSDETVEESRSLTPENYRDFFAAALRDEHQGLQRECDDHSLYRVPLVKTPTQFDRRQSMYSLRIEVGDVVQLRQLRFDQNGNIMVGAIIRHQDGRSIDLPGHPDIQHDAIIWGIDRFNGTLSLRVDSLAPRSMLFNVRFTVQSGRVGAIWKAAMITQHSLVHSRDGWLRSMLFPQQSDGQWQKSLNKVRTDLDLYDTLLNYEQLRAVENVVHTSYGWIPYIISGPPGTGKTKTIVELALQILLKKEASHLLMCAPSDSAADTLIQRLSKHLRPAQLLRLNAPSRSFPEVPGGVLPYCCIDDGMFSLPSFEQLMQLQIVVTTCRDADILLQAHLSNMTIYNLERSTHLAIHPTSDYAPTALHWTGLLIDEAAQATELEALLPLLVVAPPNEHHLVDGQLPIFVMVGDQCQLGPRTASKTTALSKSLFERILDRPMYSEHPLARSKQSGGIVRPLTQEMLPILRPAFTNLIRNYRSHPAILAIPSHLFYNDTLEPEGADTNSLRSFDDWRGRKWPVLFLSHNSPDESEPDDGGWYNLNEARMACTHAKSFLESDHLQPEDICIMSPFRAQVRVLRRTAREAPFFMPAVNIGPLEAFQGLESRLVILCTTRTRERFLEQDLAKGLGVIHEPQRFNVALTRAKHGLIVIGNPEVLAHDPNWCAFMAFCLRNRLWKHKRTGQWTNSIDWNAPIPRLERLLVQIDSQQQGQSHLANGMRRLGLANDEETALWRSGTEAAERVLQEDMESADLITTDSYTS